MTGIRNPRAHESQPVDTPESALEMIVLANHLGCVVKLPSFRRKPESVVARFHYRYGELRLWIPAQAGMTKTVAGLR